MISFRYDLGGHRTQEQRDFELTKIDDATVPAKWSKGGGGALRVWGTLSAAGTVKVDGIPGTVNAQREFEGYTYVTGPGPKSFTVQATNPEGTITSQTYNATLTAPPSADYNLDANSNVGTVSNGGPIYTWDAEDRLVKIVQGSTETNYEYDGLGRAVGIVEKQSGSTLSDRRFVWNGSERVAERSANGTLVKLFYPQGVWLAATSTSYLYATDHLGSVRDVHTPAGTVASSYDYDPYGRQTVLGTEGFATDFGYTGHWRHQPAGQSILWQAPLRAYEPSLGRWISRDPIGEAGGLDLHGYVANNPITFADPLGLCPGKRTAGVTIDTEAGEYLDRNTGAVRNSRGQALQDRFGNLTAEGFNARGSGQKLLGYSNKLADHHIMPQQFDKFFRARGIAIDDFTVTLDHMGQMPGRWNTLWEDWINANPNATPIQVFQQAGRMMDDFGINHLRIHPYGK